MSLIPLVLHVLVVQPVVEGLFGGLGVATAPLQEAIRLALPGVA